jgi:hypothetical protein
MVHAPGSPERRLTPISPNVDESFTLGIYGRERTEVTAVRSNTTVVVIRSVIAAILVVLGIGAIGAGRVGVGVLLIGLAAANVALTITMRRRRAELLRRFPNLATRVQGADGSRTA